MFRITVICYINFDNLLTSTFNPKLKLKKLKIQKCFSKIVKSQ